jgi:hypothetical protein
VLAELEAVAKMYLTDVIGEERPLAGAALSKAVMGSGVFVSVVFSARAIGLLCDIPFCALYGQFARWTRLSLWRRLLDRLRRDCGDSAVKRRGHRSSILQLGR